MQRVAFKMKLLKGCEDEYKKRHDEIWSELKALLKQTGIIDYSIFLDNVPCQPCVRCCDILVAVQDILQRVIQA